MLGRIEIKETKERRRSSLSLSLSLCVSTMAKITKLKIDAREGERLKKKNKVICFGLMWENSYEHINFLFFQFLRRRMRESFFLLSFWENLPSTNAPFFFGLLRFCHCRHFFASRHGGQNII